MNIADNPILTTEQKNLLLAFTRSELRSSFYLTGGTCLAALSMRENIDYEAIARFFKAQALSLISEDLKRGA
jgi:hypothetical protein